jgi:hypothetical protein
MTQCNKRREKRDRLIHYKGGVCIACNYTFKGWDGAVFEFHHNNPREKEFSLGLKNMNRRWDSLTKEADKCGLLCCMCHRLLHIKQDKPIYVNIKGEKQCKKDN